MATLLQISSTDQSALGQIESLLMNGNLGSACNKSAAAGFWLEAILISKNINSNAMGAVTRDYLQKAIKGGINTPNLSGHPALAIALAALGGVEPEAGF